MTCWVDKATLNVVAASYNGTANRGQLCSAACEDDTCTRVDVNMADGEYTSVLGVYKSVDGLSTAGILHVTNLGSYYVCGDGLAEASSMVTFGPVPIYGAVGGASALKSVSGLQGVCTMSDSVPYLQRIQRVCFSQCERCTAGAACWPGTVLALLCCRVLQMQGKAALLLLVSGLPGDIRVHTH